MRNNDNSFWFVTALLIASLTACSSSGGTTSSPSAVTPQITKALAVPPTVYLDSNYLHPLEEGRSLLAAPPLLNSSKQPAICEAVKRGTGGSLFTAYLAARLTVTPYGLVPLMYCVGEPPAG
jgi:hypothetical protein